MHWSLTGIVLCAALLLSQSVCGASEYDLASAELLRRNSQYFLYLLCAGKIIIRTPETAMNIPDR